MLDPEFENAAAINTDERVAFAEIDGTSDEDLFERF